MRKSKDFRLLTEGLFFDLSHLQTLNLIRSLHAS